LRYPHIAFELFGHARMEPNLGGPLCQGHLIDFVLKLQ
jgi:hypothetical protein